MTRDVKFDDHTDAAQPCKLHDARDIALAVSLLGGVGPVPKPRAGLRLERKGLRVGHVPVERVHLHEAQSVDRALDGLDGQEVTSRAASRCVFRLASGKQQIEKVTPSYSIIKPLCAKRGASRIAHGANGSLYSACSKSYTTSWLNVSSPRRAPNTVAARSVALPSTVTLSS